MSKISFKKALAAVVLLGMVALSHYTEREKNQSLTIKNDTK